MGKLGPELLRLVDVLHREREIEREIVFRGIEAALISAARKHLGNEKEITVQIDRETGEITAFDEQGPINPADLGRIAAQTGKQVMIQKIREAERDVISHDMTERIMSVVSGTVHRIEGPNLVVSLSRAEAFLPRSEQIPGETYRVGERIRALVLEVKPSGSRVRIILSRSRPELVARLFELEVPEVADGVVEIRGIAREAGYRTKVAVSSLDPRVDCVGACVGVQGSRIRNIVDELGGEKIDIVRWSDAPDVLIAHALKPAEIADIHLDEAARRADVLVSQDQLSLAIGRRGQNVRLVCKLTGWEIEIRSPEEEAARAAQDEGASVQADADASTAQPPEADADPEASESAVPEAADPPSPPGPDETPPAGGPAP